MFKKHEAMAPSKKVAKDIGPAAKARGMANGDKPVNMLAKMAGFRMKGAKK